MTSVGDILRSTRVTRGLGVSEIAAVIKLAPYLIEAMERGRFDRLPGGAYRRSFVRQYAHILGLDEDQMVATFKEQYEDPEVALPEPVIDRRSKPRGLLWAALAVAACIGGYRLLSDEHPAPSSAKPPAQPEATRTAITPPPPRVQPAVQQQPPTEAIQPVRVAFTPTEPVWISVQTDGTESFRGTLEGPGTREFVAATRMTILIGNSGGLAVSWNGHPIGPIGARGEVQLLEVTAQGAHTVPRKRAPGMVPDGAAM